jgi:hypothetical protein
MRQFDFGFKIVVRVVADADAKIVSKNWPLEGCTCPATAIPAVESPARPHSRESLVGIQPHSGRYGPA